MEQGKDEGIHGLVAMATAIVFMAGGGDEGEWRHWSALSLDLLGSGME